MTLPKVASAANAPSAAERMPWILSHCHTSNVEWLLILAAFKNADSGTPDAGGADSGTADAGASDAGASDAGYTDAGQNPPGDQHYGVRCATTPTAAGLALLVLAFLRRRTPTPRIPSL